MVARKKSTKSQKPAVAPKTVIKRSTSVNDVIGIAMGFGLVAVLVASAVSIGTDTYHSISDRRRHNA
jgi:hypothetical protein